MPEHFDVIIIGTGAGGGTLAHTLASSGKRILLLERGDFLPREMENWSPDEVFVDGRYISKDTWYDSKGDEFQPQVHYFVGGATKLYGAALYRLRPEDFGEIQHIDGVSPAWPLDLRRVRTVVLKGGRALPGARHDEVRTRPKGTTRRRIQLPLPAMSRASRRSPTASRPRGTTRSRPRAAFCSTRSDRAKSHCLRCAWCDGYPCLVHAKADAEVMAVRPSLESPNVTLLTNAMATKLETDPSGRTVTGVVVQRGPNQEVYEADVVVVAAGAANSAKLLLNSANDTHPTGLANGSDQVGRNYMFHNCKAVVSLGKEPNDTVFQKTLGINDFYFAGEGRKWPLGNIQMVGKSNAGAMKGEEPKLTLLAPHFSLDEVASHAVDWWLTTEDLPMPENRVTVDAEGNVHLRYEATNNEEADGLYNELKTILNHIGMADHHVLSKNFYMSMNVPVAGCAHQAGTVRFGHDPATSVLDTNCKAHELDNLYVVDTSFFPSIGAVNPALTAMANAIRVGEHLKERIA